MAILQSSQEHHAVMWDEEWQKMLFAWKQKLENRNEEWI